MDEKTGFNEPTESTVLSDAESNKAVAKAFGIPLKEVKAAASQGQD